MFLAPGFRFGAEQPGWFRIVFTVDQKYLDEGLSRIMAALDKNKAAVMKVNRGCEYKKSN